MERDRLDDLLRQKLKENRMTPPADLWSRIEADLTDVSPLRTETERRPATEKETSRRKTVLWRYAAAASLLLALAANFYLRRQEQPLTALHTELPAPAGKETEKRAPVGLPDTTARTAVPVPDALPDAGPEEETRRPARAIASLSSASASVPMTALRFPAKEENTANAGPEPAGHAAESRAFPKDDTEFPAERPENNSETVREEPPAREPEWYRNVREEEERPARKRRRARGVSATLYADNLTGGDFNSTGIGTPQTRSGNLLMMESVMRPPGDDILIAEGEGYTSNPETLESTYRHRTPVTFGASVGFRLSGRFALETGLLYTHLHSETENKGRFDYYREQDLHYLGIPLSATYTLVDSRYLDFYVRAGATAEVLISGRQKGRISMDMAGSSRTEPADVESHGLQTSVGAAAGAMFNISRTVGLYVEPGISHYFENSNQPASYRTEHPTGFNLRAGIRFTFR